MSRIIVTGVSGRMTILMDRGTIAIKDGIMVVDIIKIGLMIILAEAINSNNKALMGLHVAKLFQAVTDRCHTKVSFFFGFLSLDLK